MDFVHQNSIPVAVSPRPVVQAGVLVVDWDDTGRGLQILGTMETYEREEIEKKLLPEARFSFFLFVPSILQFRFWDLRQRQLQRHPPVNCNVRRDLFFQSSGGGGGSCQKYGPFWTLGNTKKGP